MSSHPTSGTVDPQQEWQSIDLNNFSEFYMKLPAQEVAVRQLENDEYTFTHQLEGSSLFLGEEPTPNQSLETNGICHIKLHPATLAIGDGDSKNTRECRIKNVMLLRQDRLEKANSLCVLLGHVKGFCKQLDVHHVRYYPNDDDWMVDFFYVAGLNECTCDQQPQASGGRSVCIRLDGYVPPKGNVKASFRARTPSQSAATQSMPVPDASFQTTPNPVPPKVYCMHWIRTGECAFVAQGGCKYKHVMPDLPTLLTLGLRKTPTWWIESEIDRHPQPQPWYSKAQPQPAGRANRAPSESGFDQNALDQTGQARYVNRATPDREHTRDTTPSTVQGDSHAARSDLDSKPNTKPPPRPEISHGAGGRNDWRNGGIKRQHDTLRDSWGHDETRKRRVPGVNEDRGYQQEQGRYEPVIPVNLDGSRRERARAAERARRFGAWSSSRGGGGGTHAQDSNDSNWF